MGNCAVGNKKSITLLMEKKICAFCCYLGIIKSLCLNIHMTEFPIKHDYNKTAADFLFTETKLLNKTECIFGEI